MPLPPGEKSGAGAQKSERTSPKQNRRHSGSNGRRSGGNSKCASEVPPKATEDVGGSPARTPAWHSKWEAMEADLMEAVDDEFSAPRFSLPEEPEPDESVSPPPRAGVPQPAAADNDIFDSRDLADLRGNAPRRRHTANAASSDTFQPALRSASVSSGGSAGSSCHTPRESKRPTTPPPATAIPPVPQRAVPSAQPLSLSAGCWVEITGLEGREELNGLVGRLEDWLQDRKRWRVRCDGYDDPVCVRSENLIVLDGPPPCSQGPDSTPEVPVPCEPEVTKTIDAKSAASPQTTEDVIEASTRSPSTPRTGQAGLSPPQQDETENEAVPPRVPLTPRCDDGGLVRVGEDSREIVESLTTLEPDVATVLACTPDAELRLRDAAQAPEDPPDATHGLEADGSDAALRTLPPPPLKAIHCLWRLWCSLVALSLLEFVLLGAAAALDRFWSPCRKQLNSCHSLHSNDCTGTSCQDGAPVWALAWPISSLVCVALPFRVMLRYVVGIGAAKPPRGLAFVLFAALGVVGLGAAALSEISVAGVHYAMRCPMERSSGRCEAHACPSPPCYRKSEFSPCLCGRLEEAEMARALFLNGIAACHPYEWYPWQMDLLEEILQKYETFSCVFGPLECVALAAGGILLVVQLACCPVLFFACWGAHEALIVFFAKEDESQGTTTKVDEQRSALPGEGPSEE